MKIKSKSRLVGGVLLIVISLWGFGDSPRVLTPAQLLAPTILGFYFTLDGIFGIIPYYMEKTRRNAMPLKSSRLWKKNIITGVKLINSFINTMKRYSVIINLLS